MKKLLAFLTLAFSIYTITPLFATPKAQNITYFDLNHNGKIDQLIVDFDGALTGTLNFPYSTGMTVYTRK